MKKGKKFNEKKYEKQARKRKNIQIKIMSVIIQNDIEEYVFFRVGSGMNNYYFFLNFFSVNSCFKEHFFAQNYRIFSKLFYRNYLYTIYLTPKSRLQ